MRLSLADSVPVLSEKLKAILNRYHVSRTMPACIIQRADIVLLSSMGLKNQEIAKKVGLHINNVGKWRRRFLNKIDMLTAIERDDADKLETEVYSILTDRPRSGAKQTFTAEQRAFIITLACQSPKEHGFELSHWSYSALRQAAINKGIVDDISVATICRILLENEIRPHKVQYWLHSTEKADSPETYKSKVKAINEAYATAKEISASGEESSLRIISTDEMTGVQALEHKYPDKLPAPGLTAKQEFEYIRHGTISLTAFFDVVTGRVEKPYLNATRTGADFVAALDQLLKSDPDKQWMIVADNLNTHYSAELVEYIAGYIGYTEPLGKKGRSGILKSKQSRAEFLSDPDHKVRFLYTPKHCSWMNQIEIWFGIINKQLLKRNSYMSVDELAASIRNYIEQYNKLFAHPFNWKYKTTPIGD